MSSEQPIGNAEQCAALATTHECAPSTDGTGHGVCSSLFMVLYSCGDIACYVMMYNLTAILWQYYL